MPYKNDRMTSASLDSANPAVPDSATDDAHRSPRPPDEPLEVAGGAVVTLVETAFPRAPLDRARAAAALPPILSIDSSQLSLNVNKSCGSSTALGNKQTLPAVVDGVQSANKYSSNVSGLCVLSKPLSSSSNSDPGSALTKASLQRVIMRNPLARNESGTDTDPSDMVLRGDSHGGIAGSSDSSSIAALPTNLGTATDSLMHASTTHCQSTSSGEGTRDTEETKAYCVVSSLVVVAVLMCVGVIIVGLLGFLPFYFNGMMANEQSIEFLLSEAMNGGASIAQNAVQMLPAFVDIITFNYMKKHNATRAQVTLPDNPETLMFSLQSVLTRFKPSIEFLRFVYTDGLYSEAIYMDNYTKPYGAFNDTTGLLTRWLMTTNVTSVDYVQPLQTRGFLNVSAELQRKKGPMKQIVVPWATTNSSRRWLFDSIDSTSTYFNYILPFEIDGRLGYCEAALSPGNIIGKSDNLTIALREHGSIVVLDYYRNIVLENSWRQPLITEERGETPEDVTYVPLRIEEINDPGMKAGIAEVVKRGGFRTVMRHTDTVLVRFKYRGDSAYLNLTRITDRYGLDITLGTTVLRSDFEKAFITARAVVISVTVSVVVLAAMIAVLIAYVVVKPLKKLVPELQRASTLEITPDNMSSSTLGGLKRHTGITEIHDIQEAYGKLKESLKAMKSYVPQAVMMNAEGSSEDKDSESADEEAVDFHDPSTVVAPRRDLRLNTKIFKEQINVFRKKTCTVVLLELRSHPDPSSITHTVDVITETVGLCSGCVEQIGLNRMLISFGAHSPLPMHASKGCQFALDVFYRLPVSVRKYMTCLVDSNEFMVGTCGARNRNSRIVFGIDHMLELVKVLWDIGCRLAATTKTTTHLPDHQSIPIECVQLQGSKVPVVLCQLLPVTSTSNLSRMATDAICYRDGFFHMRSGAYHQAIMNYNAIEDVNEQVHRLLHICQQRFATGDNSFYVRPPEDVYHFDCKEEYSSATPSHDGGNCGARVTQKGRRLKQSVVSVEDVVSPPAFNRESDCNTAEDVMEASSPTSGDRRGNRQSSNRSAFIDAPLDAIGKDDEDEADLSTSNIDSPLFNIISGSSSDADDFVPGDPRNVMELEVPLIFVDMNQHEWNRSVKKLSDGAASVVYLGMSEDGVQVAIKCIPRRRRDIREEAIEAEIHMAAKLRHPNIVQYITCSVMASHIAIIMEYVPGGSLYAVIDNFGQLSAAVVRRITVDILNGLAYLHTIGIVHCDVKPHNMLLGIDGISKLSDFGSTTEASSIATSEDDVFLRGTALYMAPEVARGVRCTPQSDVYSLGISMLEMLLGVLPWRWTGSAPPGSTPESLQMLFRSDARFVRSLGRGEVEPEIPDTLDREVLSFVRACCQVDPSKRPSAQELLSFQFLI